MQGALDGLRVVEVGTAISTAYAGRLMADLGADVVKVEHPLSGDPSRHTGPFPHDEPHPEKSGLFLYLNTNKRSLTLDVFGATGAALLARLCGSADVLICSLHPTESDSAGLSDEFLRAHNPNLTIARVTPFGMTGPNRNWLGYEGNTAAFGGICGYLGGSGRPLLFPPLAIGEYETGLNVAIPVLVADFADVAGESIDVSEADCWATVQNGMGVIEYIFGGRVFTRMGRGVKSGPYPNTILRCKDGYMRLVAMQRREWERFVGVMGDPEWASDPRFRDRVVMNEQHSDEVDALVEDWMKDRTKEEIFSLCLKAGVPFAPIFTIDEVMKRPEFQSWFMKVDHPQVPGLTQAGFPYELSESPAGLTRGAPLLGEHTAEIFEELGVENDPALRAFGVC